MENTLYVGLDIGGTKVAALIVDDAGNEVARARGAIDTATSDRLVAGIERTVDDALSSAGVSNAHISAIGAGVPGLVDPDTGEVRHAVNLNLKRFPLGTVLAETFGVPVFLENDGRIAAVGAYRLLAAASPIQHMAYINIGTGISAGLVLNGALYRGANGMAGEIGHVIVAPDGPLCACGLHGCLEAVASGSAINRQAEAHVSQFENNGPPTALTVYQQAAMGNPVAVGIVSDAGRYIAHAIHWLIMAYDVERVVLGGGVSRAGAPFLDPILVELARLREQSPLADRMLNPDKITLLPAGYDAGLWGAVLLAKSAAGIADDHL